MMLFGALFIVMPFERLGIADVPSAAVPIKLPKTWLPEAEVPAIVMPCERLPEMMLRSATVVPPMMVLVAVPLTGGEKAEPAPV